MTSDRDPQVAALLDVIEAEPPRPGFWDELERRLAGARPRPGADQVPGARSPGRGSPLGAVAP